MLWPQMTDALVNGYYRLYIRRERKRGGGGGDEKEKTNLISIGFEIISSYAQCMFLSECK